MAKNAATKMAGKKRGPPLKQCRNCGEMVHARKTVCPKCGTAFEIKTKATQKQTASNGRPARAPRGSKGSLSSIDVVAVLAVQGLIQKYGAQEVRRLVDQIERARVPF